jgi:pimeloyl-ACP methyl ester carboxylesterase
VVTTDVQGVDPHVIRVVDRMIRLGLSLDIAATVMGRIAKQGDFSMQWSEQGAYLERLAARSRLSGHVQTAKEQSTQAYFCYRIVDFSYVGNVDGKLAAYTSSLRCFDGATDGKVKELEVEAHGTSYKALFIGNDLPADSPTVVYSYGLDGIGQDHYWYTAPHLMRRGIKMLVVDGPGQGEAIRVRRIPVRPDFEALGSACYDTLASSGLADPARIGIVGSSLGSYYAGRAFLADGRFKAYATVSSLCSIVSGMWDPTPQLRPTLAYLAQLDIDKDDCRSFYLPFSLEGREQPDNSRPSRLLHGDADLLTPATEAIRAQAALGRGSEVVLVPGGNHNLFNSSAEALPQTWDWLASEL